jgi:hypothetical protein
MTITLQEGRIYCLGVGTGFEQDMLVHVIREGVAFATSPDRDLADGKVRRFDATTGREVGELGRLSELRPSIVSDSVARAWREAGGVIMRSEYVNSIERAALEVAIRQWLKEHGLDAEEITGGKTSA